jgi:hypothetical protein
LLGAAIIGGVIGSGVTLLVRGGDSATKRTAPEIVKALRLIGCEDLSETFHPSVSSPIRSSGGDWYAQCTYDFVKDGKPDPAYSCYRVKAETLEVIFLEGGPEGRPCATLPGWPKP